MDVSEALEKFHIWYFEPIEKLKELPNGNGGFVAFIVGLALYERLIIARIKHERSGSSKDIITVEKIKNAMQKDLGLTSDEQRIFWDMFRNGLLHQAMPKLGNTEYWFRHDFSGFPKLIDRDGSKCLCIDPWKFTERVINEFRSNPSLILESKSFPLPQIIDDVDNWTNDND